MPSSIKGFAAFGTKEDLKVFEFDRRDPEDNDVEIDIKYCGVCHSDIHHVENEFGFTHFPVVPGHEIAGIVKRVGSKVTNVKVGDHVGVGCFVGSCQVCPSCEKYEEPFCFKRVLTYDSKCNVEQDQITKGGYSTLIVVTERFVFRLPDEIPLDKAGPLMCAGGTTYAAIKHYGFDQPGKKIGVHGLGGLGHVAVQLLKAFGAEPVVFSHSAKKSEDAYKLGASDFVDMSNEEKVKECYETLDGCIETVFGDYSQIGKLLGAIKRDCTLVVVGAPSKSAKFEVPVTIMLQRKKFGGCIVAGTEETREMLEFCAKHQVLPWTEMIKMEDINDAYKRVNNSDVKYRFVIDIANSPSLMAA